MGSMLNSNSIATTSTVVLATAMAVSGIVIVLALRLQKSLQSTMTTTRLTDQFSVVNDPIPLPLRSCISSSSSDEKKKVEKKKKKRVRFAKDVVDPSGNGEEFRRRRPHLRNSVDKQPPTVTAIATGTAINEKKGMVAPREMPANRMALYNGILRDRVVHRLACSY